MKKDLPSVCCPVQGHSHISVYLILLIAGLMLLFHPTSASAGVICGTGQVLDKFGTCCNPENIDDCNVCFGTAHCDDGNACTIDQCAEGDVCENLPISFNATASGNNPSACGQCDGTANVTVSGGTPPYSYLWSTGATTQSIGMDETGTRLCINAGGAQFIAADGDTFTADYFYNPGTPNTATYSNFITDSIAGTDDDSLYRTERNMVATGGTMTYNIPVVNGLYDVELHFAELYYGVKGGQPLPAGGPIGKRKFDVSIEGVQVLNDYDIVADVGPAKAVIKLFTATVSDGMLDIAFTSVLNRAKVNAICVKPNAGFVTISGGLCSGTYSVTVTDSNGCEANSEIILSNLDCNDGDACTLDECISDECIFSGVICDDNDACTEDLCDSETGCHASTIICNDSNLCTDDFCDAGTGCYTTLIFCDDGDDCTTDFCDTGTGCNSTSVDCNDNDDCTYDYCDSGSENARAIDGCSHTPIDCSDSDECTEDICSNGICDNIAIPGCNDLCYNVICDDENSCTDDFCDPLTGNCQASDNAIPCSDDDVCTESDYCSGGSCQPGTPLTCDDDNLCTDNSCNPLTGCVFTDNSVSCDDNDACTYDDACTGGICIPGLPVDCNDFNACTSDNCDISTGCNHTSIVCDDGNLCTDDSCDPLTGCVYTDNSVSCNDNDACTDDDACTGGICIPGLPVDCNDFNACTSDNCDISAGCNYTAIVCDDGNLCTDDSCDPLTGCVYTDNSVSCDDNDACTDDDVCTGGICISGIPVDCDDFNDCTSDNCDISTGCNYTAVICNDDNRCTYDFCDPVSGCNYQAILCDDGNACTDNSCNPETGCVYVNNSALCDDNNACTLNDFCGGGVCQAGSPMPCDDGDPCTTDDCVSGRCNSRPVVCDDSNPCTYDECVAGTCTFTPIDCNDNDACTEDACNIICLHTNICNPCTLEVVSFTLVNALSDTDIGAIDDGGIINLFYTPNVNVRANLCVEPVGSVKFNLDGPTFKVEGSAPYALAGDNPTGNYNKWNVTVGDYTIMAIPYSGPAASGTQGTGKSITVHVINQEITCTVNTDCDDSDVCTSNTCQTGQCFYPVIDCSDSDLCTDDACSSGCTHTPTICDDNNLCTDDACNSLTGCEFSATPGCCLTSADCNDYNRCTTDACESNICMYEDASNESPYLHVVNTAKSWKKLKLGYSPTSLYTPKQNVIAGGNNTLCITLRGSTGTDWSKIQVRPQGSVSTPVSLGSYGLGTTFTQICIPLSSFGVGVDFTQLTLIEIPYSNGAGAFQIDIQKIEFTGGATPFLWFGDSKTDNKHDGGSNGSLLTTLEGGLPCGGGSKMSEENSIAASTYVNAYPNPFSEKLNIEFTLSESTRAKLEIFNLAGQSIAQLFEGNVSAGTLMKFEFTSTGLPEGMLIYRLQTDKETVYGKSVFVR